MSARPTTTWSTRHDHIVVWSSAVVLAGLALVPFAASDRWLRSIAEFLILVTLAQWWALLAGRGGVPWLATHGFVGVGAYASLVLVRDIGLPIPIAVVSAAVLVALFMLALGPIVTRLRGGSFVVATLVLAELAGALVLANDQLDGGEAIVLDGPGANTSFWLVLAIFGLSILGVVLIGRSSLGLGLTALRSDFAVAAALGVSWRRTLVPVVALSAAGMAAAGAAWYLGAGEVSADAFSFDRWLAPSVLIAMLGGRRTIEGPIVGAVLYVAIRAVLPGSDAWVLVVVASASLIILASGVDGIWGLIRARLPSDVVATNRRITSLDPAPRGRAARTRS